MRKVGSKSHSCLGGFSGSNGGCFFDLAPGDDPDCSGCATGTVTTTAWADGHITFVGVTDTNGNVFLDSLTGVGMGSGSTKPFGAPSDGALHWTPDPAANLVGATFNSPGAALSDFACGGGAGCGLALAVGLAVIGLGEDSSIIGLGIDEDLDSFAFTDAITYRNGGWQQAGLTNVEWSAADSSAEGFQQSFIETASNADAIRFDVSNFDPAYQGDSMTSWEFETIVNTPSLFDKTTFIQNGQQVLWNGAQFTGIP